MLSVMESAVEHGFAETRLPDYMQSFCEVRLAITGPDHSLRSENNIEKICNAFQKNLENDLKESLASQLEQKRESTNDNAVVSRLPTAEGHNATLHAYCMATSDCALSSSIESSIDSSSTPASSTKFVVTHDMILFGLTLERVESNKQQVAAGIAATLSLGERHVEVVAVAHAAPSAPSAPSPTNKSSLLLLRRRRRLLQVAKVVKVAKVESDDDENNENDSGNKNVFVSFHVFLNKVEEKKRVVTMMESPDVFRADLTMSLRSDFPEVSVVSVSKPKVSTTTTTTTKHSKSTHKKNKRAHDPETKCDRCASNLMSSVNKWRAETEGEAPAITRETFQDSLHGWCVARLDRTWIVRKDLINVTCEDTSIMPPTPEGEETTPPLEDDYLFNPSFWKALDPNGRAHRDLTHLYHVCIGIGECTAATPPGTPSTSPSHQSEHSDNATTASKQLEPKIDSIVVPSEEEQDKLDRLVEESKQLERERKEAAEALKKAEAMEFAAKDRESKAEEDADANKEAADACRASLVELVGKRGEKEIDMGTFCSAASDSEKKLEDVAKQLRIHTEEVSALDMARVSASNECDEAKKEKKLTTGKLKMLARKKLVKCARSVNVQLQKLNELERQAKSNPNYPAGSDALHPTLDNIRSLLSSTNRRLRACEESEVLEQTRAEEEEEKASSDCSAKISTLKQARERSLSIKRQTSNMQEEQAAAHGRNSLRCATAKDQLKTQTLVIRATTIKCNEADALVESSVKKSASAAAAAAAIEVAKATAKQQEERLDNEENGSMDNDNIVSAATGGKEGVTTEEMSDNADTYGGCALDVMAYARHVELTRKKKNKKKSLWGLVSAWALTFCKAEAESARSRAILVGKPFHVDANTACGFASNIFLEARRGMELETTLKFCRTMRQFTGVPLIGLVYDRQRQHILPKAPLSLRPEHSTSAYTFGPGPISKTSQRSSMEWYGNKDEMLRLRHNKYGRGNMDYLMAPQDADVAARAQQPKNMIENIEASFASKWAKEQREKGIKFVEEPEDVVLEPNRQLKVPTPLHRLVGAVGNQEGEATGGEEEGEAEEELLPLT